MSLFRSLLSVLFLSGALIALAASSSSSPPGVAYPGGTRVAPYYRVTIASASIASTRPDGSPWHTTAPGQTWKTIGAIAGVFAGQAELGMAAGSLFDDPGGSSGPAPMVELSFNGDTYETAALAQTLDAAWDEDIIIDTSRSRASDRVVIMIKDGIDNGVIARTELTMGEFVAREGHTLSMGSSVASLELRVREAAPRRRDEIVEVPSNGVRIAFDGGDIVKLTASGEVCVRADRCFGPDGDDAYQSTGSVADFQRPRPRGFQYNRGGFEWTPHGSLVATFQGRPISVGSSTTMRIPRAGELILWVNDKDTGNNEGSFTVNVQVNSELGLSP